MFATQPKHVVTLFAVLAWLLWGERNARIFEPQNCLADGLVTKAQVLIAEWRELDIVDVERPLLATQRTWQPPMIGEIKVNVDAAVDMAARRYGVGVVTRNAAGVAVFASAVSFPGVVSAEMAELVAIRVGFQQMIQHDWGPVVLESDALTPVKLCNGLLSTQTVIDNLVQDIIVLRNMYGIGSILHVSRISNSVAHGLAKKSSTLR